jgi:copper chaperone CopZ
MSKMNFEISGVHCPSCKILITDILEDEKVKVNKFDVDVKKQKGTISIDASQSEEEIKELIQGAGEYKVKKV